MKTIPVNPTKWPQKQKRFLALIATVAISDRATFVAILELLRLLQKIWSRIERNQMSDTPRTDSEKQRFILEDNLDDTEMVPSEFCEKLERELNAANERIKRLVEIGNEMVNLMSGDESVPYDDWICQSWDAKCKWEEASRNR